MTPCFGAVSRFVLLLLTTLTILTLGASRPALADCVVNGTVVTCSGNSPGGFAAGPGVTDLTVNVLQGAAVGTGISLNDNNTPTIKVTDSYRPSLTSIKADIMGIGLSPAWKAHG